MKQRPRIYYTQTQKALMWERWKKGESLQQIAQLFDREHASIRRILAETGGIRPPERCRSQLALGRKFKIRGELAPDASVVQLLDLVQWPEAKGTVVVVGHQPTLGQTIAQLIGFDSMECAVKKGAVWWLRNRQREAQSQTVIVTVQSPEIL